MGHPNTILQAKGLQWGPDRRDKVWDTPAYKRCGGAERGLGAPQVTSRSLKYAPGLCFKGWLRAMSVTSGEGLISPPVKTTVRSPGVYDPVLILLRCGGTGLPKKCCFGSNVSRIANLSIRRTAKVSTDVATI